MRQLALQLLLMAVDVTLMARIFVRGIGPR